MQQERGGISPKSEADSVVLAQIMGVAPSNKLFFFFFKFFNSNGPDLEHPFLPPETVSIRVISFSVALSL